jgi:hypothetical protein
MASNEQPSATYATALAEGHAPPEAAREVKEHYPALSLADLASAIRQAGSARTTAIVSRYVVSSGELAVSSLVDDAVALAQALMGVQPTPTPEEIAVALRDPRVYPNLTAAEMTAVLAKVFPNITPQQMAQALTAAYPPPQNVALEFIGRKDGGGAYVRVSDDLQLSDKFTLEAFVYWNGTAGYLGVISKPRIDDGRAGTGYALALSDGKPMLGLITASGANRSGAASASPIPANAWTAVAVSYDGQRGITYVNGTEVGRREWQGMEGAHQGATALLIGREFLSGYPDRAFGGRLADVRIWKAVLPADTIAAWCGKQSLDGHPQTAALAARWLFDEGQGSVAHDSSGHGHDGVLNGATWSTSAGPIKC